MFEFAPAIPSRSDLDWCWYLRREGQIGEALERVLHDIGVIHPGGWANWYPSTMTDTGAPVEMHFTADQTALCVRTEVEDPSKNPSSRLAKACDLITRLGGAPPHAALLDVICTAQGAADLRFGAWLGLHQCADKLGTTLYAELPGAAADLIELLPTPQIISTLAPFNETVSMTMLGYTSATDEVTLYFETMLAPKDIIPTLANVAKVSAEPLLREISGMLDVGVSGDGRIGKFSFSFTLHKDGPPTLTLLVSTKVLFGSDKYIAQLVRAFPGDHVAAYAGLEDQLSPAPNGKIHHGNIGMQARGERCPLFSINVAAPWICHLDTFSTRH